MNRIVLAAIACVVVVGAVVAAWIFLGEEEAQEIRVERGSIDVTIQTIGRVETASTQVVRAPVSGEVAVVAVEPGDTVTTGDIVVQLVTEPLERAVADAERRLEDAEFSLQAAQRESDENPDDENLQFAVVRASQQVEAAELALADAEEDLRNANIRVDAPGIVLDTPVQTGSIVNRTSPVTIVYARDDLHIVANVDELDLVNVQIGADATMRLDAYPDQEIPGTVVATAPAALEQGGATVFETTLTLDLPEDIDIRPGMNADVTIVTDARDDALLIPQSAIRSVGNRAFVQLVVDGESVEREVILGYRSAGQAEVVSGLEEGDIIRIP